MRNRRNLSKILLSSFLASSALVGNTALAATLTTAADATIGGTDGEL